MRRGLLAYVWRFEMAGYVLAALVALLVIYLLYAVIHPERF